MSTRSACHVLCVLAVLSSVAGGEEGSCGCASEVVLDRDCCSCTVTQVAEAARSHFKDILTQVVETPFFRLYAPYTEQPGKELYDVECSIPEFRELEQQLSASQLGCAIAQCGCQEAECSSEEWRREPCFAQCEESARRAEDSISNIGRTIPAASTESVVQYDLIDNPEQFTGYGTLLDDQSARMIWDSLYTDQFCFSTCPEEAESEHSAEKRLVYKIVSGLHASINTHLAMHYGIYSDSHKPATRESWVAGRELYFGPWRELFDARVGSHPDRVRNMHFVFTLLLRAVHRLHPHLDRVLEAARSCPKCAAHHNTTQDLLSRLLEPPDDAADVCEEVLQAFDPSKLFAAGDAMALRAEVETRLQRMGELMTCVGCDRCKLWGTLQFHAARVAIGILTSTSTPGTLVGAADVPDSPYAVPSIASLRPNDIVALVNALAQVSKSIDQANEWTRPIFTLADEL